jgi:hypothetical protein
VVKQDLNPHEGFRGVVDPSMHNFDEGMQPQPFVGVRIWVRFAFPPAIVAAAPACWIVLLGF